VAVNVFAAETDAEAESLFTSLAQAFRNLMRGTPGKLPAPVAKLRDVLSPSELDALDSMLRFTVRGTPDRVREGLEALTARTRADELIVAAQIFEPRARLRSFEIVAEVAKA
jgi:alkanesulfonate monooxygenase SsuD/methylene tetrahydromethanopterin reductase-like flavin-dependent oxidoreductase (luciferase family)